mmetsp:Transcript_1253/g.1920  ORF Transcript_1253/g.1920 Transcript_1253/m.1920 type:complete len:309 (+) Transcript_1253:74-1000(+)|eukprot:CAMPEP_0197232866 /NCGR_PEP_ID=MMETSP1429-20130617/1085_1 /TAXON_ID=49237 /ORGANISM="Chaetoceros  sp., Strain UNC1202" /LENGTH=308 /DNA_ID=CAMNT_0042691007 /DNA_START=141 /DNA_END=1067 /DNA_ORIENTATION=-
MSHQYQPASSGAPSGLTIHRLDSVEELILAQSTSQCCRSCCCQKSINWVISEQDRFEVGTDPFHLPTTGWIHEESSFSGRCWSWLLPGCREVKYVQHHGTVPTSLTQENADWCTCQTDRLPMDLSVEDSQSNIVATHEKKQTCGYCFKFGDITFPICNCFPLPYLVTKTTNGSVVGHTRYVCDECLCVPKFDVFDASGNKKFRVRPDVCFMGCCIQCRCDSGKKCLRVPFVVRDPNTLEPIESAKVGDKETRNAKIDSLWTGWKNACCSMKDAYHVVYPARLSAEDKLLLTGSGLLIDLTMFEQKQDD